MAVLESELRIPPGLVSDDTAFSRAGCWIDGNNFAFRGGRPQVIGAFKRTFANALTGIVRNIFAFKRAGATRVAYGTSSKLYLGLSSPVNFPNDVTPVSGWGTNDSIALAAWGDVLLATAAENEGSCSTLFQQSGAAAATAVAEAPDEIRWMLVARRQVLAFGCNEVASGTFNGRCIRGSNFEDYSSAGSWTPTSANNSFEDVLDGAGNIVTARELAGYILVWTEDALWLGSFVGDPAQTYRWDLVDNNCGIAGPHAATIMSGVAYWLGPDLQFRRYALGGLPEIIPCPIWRDFEMAVTRTAQHLLHASTVSKHNEVWFHYGTGAGYVAFDVREGSWFKGDAGCTAMLDSGLINEALEDDLLYTGVIGSSAGFVHARELGGSSSIGAADGPSAYHIQSGDFYIEGGGRSVTVQAVRPDINYGPQNDSMELSLHVRQRPQSPATAKGPFPLVPSTTRRSVRATGNLVSVKFSGVNPSNADARIGCPVFEYTTGGRRP